MADLIASKLIEANGKPISKMLQLSNWSKYQLNKEELLYCADDAYYCLKIWLQDKDLQKKTLANRAFQN